MKFTKPTYVGWSGKADLVVFEEAILIVAL